MSKLKSTSKKREGKLVKHYDSSHSILLVGEGDFSFSACLANDFGSAKNMVATCLDSKDMLLSKYLMAAYNIKKLKEMGCTVIYEVDAKTMNSHPLLSRRRFDRIIFNFPHAGFTYREHDSRQIKLHQEVVGCFFKSAFKMMTLCGQIHVTHKTAYPFSKWEVKKLAKNAGLDLLDEVPFYIWDFPGYQNKRGATVRSDETFPVGECSIYKFSFSYDIDEVGTSNSHRDMERWEKQRRFLQNNNFTGTIDVLADLPLEHLKEGNSWNSGAEPSPPPPPSGTPPVSPTTENPESVHTYIPSDGTAGGDHGKKNGMGGAGIVGILITSLVVGQ